MSIYGEATELAFRLMRLVHRAGYLYSARDGVSRLIREEIGPDSFRAYLESDSVEATTYIRDQIVCLVGTDGDRWGDEVTGGGSIHDQLPVVAAVQKFDDVQYALKTHGFDIDDPESWQTCHDGLKKSFDACTDSIRFYLGYEPE